MDVILDVRLNPREICTAQQKGACVMRGRIHFFTKKRVQESNARIRRELVSALRRLGVEIGESAGKVGSKTAVQQFVRDTIPRGRPIRLDVCYFFPFPTSTPKWMLSDNSWMVENPDLDNLTKSVQDELTRLRMWYDDGQLSCVHYEKFRTTGRPRIAIRVRTMDDCLRPDIGWAAVAE